MLPTEVHPSTSQPVPASSTTPGIMVQQMLSNARANANQAKSLSMGSIMFLLSDLFKWLFNNPLLIWARGMVHWLMVSLTTA